MKTACYGTPHGRQVTPEEFIAKATPLYKNLGIFPYCPICKTVVDVYGVHSPNTTSRFDHPNFPSDADPMDDCILANRNSRFKGLQPSSIDLSQGHVVRSAFFDKSNLKQSYSFMHSLCGRSLLCSVFNKCIDRADKNNIWSYKDIPLWSLPFILLTLENFSNSKYCYHFILKKTKNTFINEIWTGVKQAFLVKVFSDSGKEFKNDKNPMLISNENFHSNSQDVDWISDALITALKKSN